MLRKLLIALALVIGTTIPVAATAVPAHAASCSHPYKFTMVNFGTGSIDDNGGVAYQEPNYSTFHCQVAGGYGSPWYQWVINGYNLCMTFNATYNDVDYITCRGLVSQQWSIFKDSTGHYYFFENDYNGEEMTSGGNYAPVYEESYNPNAGIQKWLITQ